MIDSMIMRLRLSAIRERLDRGKAIIIVGARQVGKTTLTNELLKAYDREEIIILNGDNLEAQRLSKLDFATIDAMFADYRCILIDEAHKVNRIGDIAKSLIDKYGKSKQIVLTGSSTINLIDKTSEPLTGRKRVFELYPISLEEMALSGRKVVTELKILLSYGLYPEVLNEEGLKAKQDAVMELAESSLYRDVLDVTGARASGDLVALLRYLAQHIGETISINEVSNKLSIDRRTIDRYIDLLTKSFIVFTLYPYTSTGSSIRRSYKVYFWDVGIRNALVEDFSSIDDRADAQALWQNFIIAERLKSTSYNEKLAKHYFWRSYDGAEMDLVELEGTKLRGYRISYSGKYIRESKVFNEFEPTSQEVITPDNFKQIL